ncbi:hypothetical protein BDY21DRAFT_334141 [Lineolata rhizophorae]|uniref:Uncharacterized protein n=1 Tax=Lineolata rhizophorae TaxID=578093 RepID=A0A6A6PAR3_9PEZI|nr:hypothetical protein BDY21DRAFT_334141 [Lineolata rhizophorae]
MAPERATRVWKGLRVGSYVSVGLGIGWLFGKLSGMMAAMVSDQNKKLEQMAKDMHGREGSCEEMAGMVRAGAQSRRRAGQSGRSSPESGDTSSQDGEAWDGGTVSTSEDSNTSQPPSSRWQTRASPASSQDRSFSWSRAKPSQDDDMSPTGGSGIMDDISAESGSAASGGSSWAKVRAQAMGRPQQPSSAARPDSDSWSSSQSKQEQSRQGDDATWAFSSEEEEKQLARSEAQKEFDARVERERHGRSFDDRSYR